MTNKVCRLFGARKKTWNDCLRSMERAFTFSASMVLGSCGSNYVAWMRENPSPSARGRRDALARGAIDDLKNATSARFAAEKDFRPETHFDHDGHGEGGSSCATETVQ